jgi:hypothetical protein
MGAGIVIAHDPGRRAGWARFAPTGDLLMAQRTMLVPVPGELVLIEMPESRGGKTPASTDDLIVLARRAADYGGYSRAHRAEVEYVKPSRWKGTVRKDICCARTLAALTEAERVLVDHATHDVIDAVGLGLWHFRRKGIRK